jgi:hypothetical protein
VTAARRWWPPAAATLLAWAVAAATAAAAAGYDAAPWWLLLLNQVVLAPLAVVSAWSLGTAVAGRVLGAIAPFVLVALPPLGAAYALSGYEDTYVDRVLPSLVGIAAGGSFAAAALLAAAAALLLGALDPGLVTDRHKARLGAQALAAGTVAGIAALVEPSAALFLVGAALASACALAPRTAAAVAAGAALPVLVAALRHDGGPLDVSWDAWSDNMAQLREYTWSNRLLQWLPVAGAIAAARGSLPAACLLGGWFGAFALAEGASPNVPVQDGSFFLAFQPALPALALLAACLPLLVPTLPARLERLEARLP